MPSQSSEDRAFEALSDPTRRALIERLSEGPASVSDLARPLGITLAAVIQQLQLLERCGLIRSEKTGRVRTCSLDLDGLGVAERWLQERHSPRVDRVERPQPTYARKALAEEED